MKTRKKPGDAPSLLLAIGDRAYRVRLEWWTADNCHVVLLDDIDTGQTTRVVDLSNMFARYRRGAQAAAACSCSPDRETVECRHVRACRKTHLLPNWTRTEGED